MKLSVERATFLVGLGIALALLWQASQLDAWSILGPGPGLFAQVTTVFTAGIAALLVVFPRLAQGPDRPAAESEEKSAPAERRLFLIYGAALVFLAVAPPYLGFALSSIVLVMALTWAAERRAWRAALVFGVLCGVVGTAGFGHVLGATIPLGAIDRALLQLFR